MKYLLHTKRIELYKLGAAVGILNTGSGNPWINPYKHDHNISSTWDQANHISK
jgi:hypothetical protein